jgi:hypothetical protein
MGPGKTRSPVKRRLAFVLLLASLAGCASNTTFVYKPPAPAAGARKLPVKIAVLPFKDGTEDFTKRGNELFDQQNLVYNLAKAGIGSTITALTPDLWAKAFADDLASSGDFRAATFLYGASELKDEDFVVEGAVEKAVFSGTWDKPNEFALSLRATRRSEDRPAWQRRVARVWKTPPPGILYDGCGMGPQCMVDRLHADLNQTMQGMFAEAREGLLRTLASRPGSRGGREERADAGSPAPDGAPKSVEETIEGILKGE